MGNIGSYQTAGAKPTTVARAASDPSGAGGAGGAGAVGGYTQLRKMATEESKKALATMADRWTLPATDEDRQRLAWMADSLCALTYTPREKASVFYTDVRIGYLAWALLARVKHLVVDVRTLDAASVAKYGAHLLPRSLFVAQLAVLARFGLEKVTFYTTDTDGADPNWTTGAFATDMLVLDARADPAADTACGILALHEIAQRRGLKERVRAIRCDLEYADPETKTAVTGLSVTFEDAAAPAAIDAGGASALYVDRINQPGYVPGEPRRGRKITGRIPVNAEPLVYEPHLRHDAFDDEVVVVKYEHPDRNRRNSQTDEELLYANASDYTICAIGALTVPHLWPNCLVRYAKGSRVVTFFAVVQKDWHISQYSLSALMNAKLIQKIPGNIFTPRISAFVSDDSMERLCMLFDENLDTLRDELSAISNRRPAFPMYRLMEQVLLQTAKAAAFLHANNVSVGNLDYKTIGFRLEAGVPVVKLTNYAAMVCFPRDRDGIVFKYKTENPPPGEAPNVYETGITRYAWEAETPAYGPPEMSLHVPFEQNVPRALPFQQHKNSAMAADVWQFGELIRQFSILINNKYQYVPIGRYLSRMLPPQVLRDVVFEPLRTRVRAVAAESRKYLEPAARNIFPPVASKRITSIISAMDMFAPLVDSPYAPAAIPQSVYDIVNKEDTTDLMSQCMHANPAARPTMREVVASLEAEVFRNAGMDEATFESRRKTLFESIETLRTVTLQIEKEEEAFEPDSAEYRGGNEDQDLDEAWEGNGDVDMGESDASPEPPLAPSRIVKRRYSGETVQMRQADLQKDPILRALVQKTPSYERLPVDSRAEFAADPTYLEMKRSAKLLAVILSVNSIYKEPPVEFGASLDEESIKRAGIFSQIVVDTMRTMGYERSEEEKRIFLTAAEFREQKVRLKLDEARQAALWRRDGGRVI